MSDDNIKFTRVESEVELRVERNSASIRMVLNNLPDGCAAKISGQHEKFIAALQTAAMDFLGGNIAYTELHGKLVGNDITQEDIDRLRQQVDSNTSKDVLH